MTNKYSRHQSVINRTSDESIGEDNWLKQLEKNLEKTAVQPRAVDSSLFDQINSIMNSKSKYPSVAAAVEDMKERSGLKAYLDKKASDENDVMHKKITSKETGPVIFIKCPKIKNTFENYIKETKGNLPVPAIIEKIRSIHNHDVSDAKDWECDNLIKYVSDEVAKEKASHSNIELNEHNLGKADDMNDSDIDPSNTDMFHALTPVKF